MITVIIKYECGGCFKKADVETHVHKEFVSFSGKPGGFGRYHITHPDYEALVPSGWVAFDPYTQCTYCPECWASINNEDGEDRAA